MNRTSAINLGFHRWIFRSLYKSSFVSFFVWRYQLDRILHQKFLFFFSYKTRVLSFRDHILLKWNTVSNRNTNEWVWQNHVYSDMAMKFVRMELSSLFVNHCKMVFGREKLEIVNNVNCCQSKYRVLGLNIS